MAVGYGCFRDGLWVVKAEAEGGAEMGKFPCSVSYDVRRAAFIPANSSRDAGLGSLNASLPRANSTG